MADGMTSRFEHVIESEADLRAITGTPGPRAAQKVIDRIDQHCADFIARSPLAMVASSGADGTLDLSPKGDPAGFVLVLDEKTLAVPDRPGNRRADTFSNVLVNPKVGLIFLIPGKRETLRVSGVAQVVRDAWLLERLQAQDRTPDLALVVHVERVMFHCAKCMIRSGLWQPDSWPELAGLAPLGQVIVDHGRLSESAAEVDRVIERDASSRLY